MKYLLLAFGFGLFLAVGSDGAPRGAVANPNIDMDGYLKVSREAAAHRATHRVSEDEFLKMAGEPNTIILDCRSKQMYDLLHVKGAINLNFSDITVESVKKTIPDKSKRILIYCNNNFKNSPRAFATKMATASLNLSSYIALFNYGYKNVYELAPLLDPKDSKIPFEGTGLKTEVPAQAAKKPWW